MKKEWNSPEVEALSINGTEYNPNGGKIQDGLYVSKDGKYEIPTMGTSNGNSGIPDVGVTEDNK